MEIGLIKWVIKQASTRDSVKQFAYTRSATREPFINVIVTA